MKKYQGISRVQYDKGETVLICCPFSNAKAFGFVLSSDLDIDAEPQTECGLIDLWNLDSSNINNFPSGNRVFKENIWRKISETTPILNEDRLFNTEEDLCEIEQEHEEDQKKSISIAYCTHDFNFHKTDCPLLFDILDSNGWEESSIQIKVPFLSCGRNDIIITTRLPDKNGWLEGYKANEPCKSIGIIHKDFIEFFTFKD